MVNDLSLQKRFIDRIGSRLDKFTQKRPDLWNFAHSCEDGTKVKKRAFIGETDGRMHVYCHHCGYSSPFQAFLKQEDSTLYSEFLIQKFKPETEFKIGATTFAKVEPAPVPVIVKPKVELLPIEASEVGLEYVLSRGIPRLHFDRIFFADDFPKWAASISDAHANLRGGPRIVFPYYDKENQVFGYNCRAMNSQDKPKYIKIKLNKEKELVYGLWRVKSTGPLLLVEGNIDSLFLPNAAGVGGVPPPTMDIIRENVDRLVYVPDNDFARNREVNKAVRKLVDAGVTISFLPEISNCKDINDIILSGEMTPRTLYDHILSNAKRGLSAKLELTIRCKL